MQFWKPPLLPSVWTVGFCLQGKVATWAMGKGKQINSVSVTLPEYHWSDRRAACKNEAAAMPQTQRRLRWKCSCFWDKDPLGGWAEGLGEDFYLRLAEPTCQSHQKNCNCKEISPSPHYFVSKVVPGWQDVTLFPPHIICMKCPVSQSWWLLSARPYITPSPPSMQVSAGWWKQKKFYSFPSSSSVITAGNCQCGTVSTRRRFSVFPSEGEGTKTKWCLMWCLPCFPGWSQFISIWIDTLNEIK